MRCLLTRTAAGCLWLLGLFALAPAAAHAYATASALAQVKVTVQSIVNQTGAEPVDLVQIMAGTSVDQADAFGAGVGAVVGSERGPLVDTAIGVGGAVSLLASAATAGQSGLGTAISRTAGFLDLYNSSAADVFTVDLLIEYVYALAVGASHIALGESAMADALIELTSDLLGVLVLEQPGLVGNEPDRSLSGSFVQSLDLLPGEGDYWRVYNDALARISAVAAPSPLLLILAGPLALAARVRRRAVRESSFPIHR